MARTREFDPAKTLDKALRLFWRQGYLDTTIDDLVEATGVSRYGLYGTFGGKEELYDAVLKHYRDNIIESIFGDLRNEDASLPELRSFFGKLVAGAKRGGSRDGCLVCNTAVELADTDSTAKRHVRGHFKRMKTLFHRALDNAKARGEIAKSADTASYAEFLLCLAQGMFVLDRAAVSWKELDRQVVVAFKAIV